MSDICQTTNLNQLFEPEPMQVMLKLKQLGVTEEQIANSRFLPKYRTCRLEDRPFTWDPSIPNQGLARILPLLRWALIYRIIVSEHGSDSPFHKQACRELAMLEVGFEVATGQRYRERQRSNASHSRKRDPIPLLSNVTMAEVVEDLLEPRANRNSPPRELWPLLFAWLDDHGLSPAESHGEYTYNYDDAKRRSITMIKFRRLVRLARKKVC